MENIPGSINNNNNKKKESASTYRDKSTISEINNTLEGTKSRVSEGEEVISVLE